MISFLLNNYNKSLIINSGIPSPIWHAADQGYSDIVDLLIANGCNVDNAAPDGTSPLMIALLNNDFQTVQKFKNVSQHFENIVQEFLLEEPHDDEEDSPIKDISHIYPNFNAEIMANPISSLKTSNSVKYTWLQGKALPHFCPLKHYDLRNQVISEFQSESCGDTCKQ